MGQVYSKQLQQLVGPPAGSYRPSPPAAGLLWIIRDIQASYQGATAWPAALSGLYLETDEGGVIWNSDVAPQVGYSLQWQGRTVLAAGESFTTVTLDDGWHVIVSGYELTLP